MGGLVMTAPLLGFSAAPDGSIPSWGRWPRTVAWALNALSKMNPRRVLVTGFEEREPVGVHSRIIEKADSPYSLIDKWVGIDRDLDPLFHSVRGPT